MVIKNFITYSLGAIILRCITAAISLISINFLTPAEFGILSLINTFIWIAPVFLNLGLRQAYGIDFFHTDNFGRKKILNDIICIYLIFSIPIFIFAILNLQIINKYLFLNQLEPQIILIILIICFVHFFTELLFLTYRYQCKSFLFTATQIFMGIVTAITTFILIYFFNLKILGIVIGNLIGMLAITIIGLKEYLIKIGMLKFQILQNVEKIKYYFTLGLPFVPNLFFAWTLSFGDRWLLAKFCNLHDVGIYSLADSFAQLFQMIIIYPLTGAYIPYILKTFSENKDNLIEVDKVNQKNMFICMFFMLVISVLGFLLFKNLFYLIFPAKYYESLNYILILIIGQIFYLGTFFANCYFQYLKKTYYIVSFTIFAALLNVFLNILLIPKYSIYGCAFATLISYFIYLITILIITRIEQDKYIKKNSKKLFLKRIS